MAEGRDFSHSAYQAPFMEQYGPYIGGVVLAGLLVGGVMWWKPWDSRKPTALKVAEPIRLSTAKDVHIEQTRPTRRIAVHGSTVYATWVDDRTVPASCMLAVSTDSGKTFTEKALPPASAGQELSDPALLCDSMGSVYLLFTFTTVKQRDPTSTGVREGGERKTKDRGGEANLSANARARLARSDDSGDTWRDVRDVQSSYTGPRNGAVMDVDSGDRIYVAGIAGLSSQIIVTRTVNRGASFEDDVEVSTAPKGSRRDVAMEVTPEGRVCVAWSDRRNMPELLENGEIFGALANSYPNFSPDKRLVTAALKPARQRSPQVLLDDQQHLGILWVEGIDREHREDTVLRWSYSTTQGESFQEPVTLFENKLAHPAAPQLTRGDGDFWYLTTLGTMTDQDQPTVVVAHTRNAGQSWTALTPLIERRADALAYPSIAVQENTILATYMDYADPTGKPGSLEVYAMRLEDAAVRP